MARSAAGSPRDRRTGRWPLSWLAGTRAKTRAALADASSEHPPAARAPSLTNQPGRATQSDSGRELGRLLLKVVVVDLRNAERSHRNADFMIDHQISKAGTINQDNLLN